MSIFDGAAAIVEAQATLDALSSEKSRLDADYAAKAAFLSARISSASVSVASAQASFAALNPGPDSVFLVDHVMIGKKQVVRVDGVWTSQEPS